MLDQTNIFRAHGLGSFREMARAVTADPAMLLFLDGIDNRRGRRQRELRPRADGAVHARRRPRRLHRDRRARARAALSGWTATTATAGTNLRWDEAGRWDFSVKTVFGRSGRFTWEDAVELVRRPIRCTRRSSSASSGATSSRRRRTPRRRPRSRSTTWRTGYADPAGARGDPVLAAVLRGPADGQAAGRARWPACCARPPARIENNEWWNKSDRAGQRLYYPPDVSGWDDKRWLDTNTTVGRWEAVGVALAGTMVKNAEADAYPERDARRRRRRRARLLGRPAR